MRFPKKPHRRHKSTSPQNQGYENPQIHDLMDPEHTGSEAVWFRSLIDSRAEVTVVLTSGEKLRGRIRYYDRHCFSIGLSARGPRFFLRKSSVSHIETEQPETA
jgi:sRNA-binding regulator protein Hfq